MSDLTWRVRITGQVQGVGFRPFVHRLATELQLAGWVCNDAGGVVIRAWGDAAQLEEFVRRLGAEAPALASVGRIEHAPETPPEARPAGFRIVASDTTARQVGRVTVDSAVCRRCLGELRDPADRRYRHPLINCTECGPRFSIIRDMPYDRPRTTMRAFAMCARCRAEYEDPGDRRFHAQPVCCHECGPALRLLDGAGRPIEGEPIAGAAGLLAGGKVVAIKGLGGYHLAVDAGNEAAVVRLRRGKRRDRKPFAIMARDVAAARRIVSLSAEGMRLLESPAAPIVLARRAEGSGQISAPVAPDSDRLGIMLPYTPVQHLLFDEPALREAALVMTSANYSDDPLLIDDERVLAMAGIFDAVLLHDRPIERAVDDSVVLDSARGPVLLRRARGYAPAPLAIPVEAPAAGLCLGADLKSVIAVVRGAEAICSQHVGDLEYPLAHRRFEETIEDFVRLFDVAPQWIACDRHPRYLSRRVARRLAAQRGWRLIEIQHHHAHMGSLMAEHGRTAPLVCLVCDGVGYGEDATAWGCETLVGDLGGFQRHARLRPLRLPGGDRAARETWRCALSWLHDCGRGDQIKRLDADAGALEGAVATLRADLNCPISSGLGRLFDAGAALLGVCARNEYEAMSGMALEALAREAGGLAGAGEGLTPLRPAVDRAGAAVLELDHAPLLERLLAGLEAGEPAGRLAWLLHDAIGAGLAEAARSAARGHGVGAVGLSGGVFCNELLTDLVAGRLEAAGLEVLTHASVPPNDGGIACGQAAIASAWMAQCERRSHVPCAASQDR
ncbi:MAG: carbamoyltransferase HypF [Phycisphaerales bacterium JB039]